MTLIPSKRQNSFGCASLRQLPFLTPEYRDGLRLFFNADNKLCAYIRTNIPTSSREILASRRLLNEAKRSECNLLFLLPSAKFACVRQSSCNHGFALTFGKQSLFRFFLFFQGKEKKERNEKKKAYYGYNSANTRTYKLSFLNTNQWVNGQPQPLDLQLQNAMYYPNAYLNFNHSGEYTKHYYNGAERIASRLGDNTQMMEATSNDRLDCRVLRAEELMREGIKELVSEEQPVEFHSMPDPNALQPTIATSDIFYYHTNHLGSTAFVTDQNQTVTQGFLYAPFGEITTEYNATFGNNVLPKYSFNAKELDEETGMYYYEARYYKPPGVHEQGCDV